MAPPIPEVGPEMAGGVIAAIAAFLTISILLGFFMRKKAKNFEEWLVGRGDIGPLVTGFALVASYLSGWAIFGNAGLGYAYGWSGSWLIGTICVMGTAICLVIGYRMRRYVAFGARTVPEMLRVRFESRTVQALAGLAMIILLIVYSVGQYKAMATVWTITTNIPFYGSLLTTAILVLIYLIVGGYTGTQWVSCFQGILLTIIGWTLGIAVLFWAGGPAQIAGSIGNQTFTYLGGNQTEIPLGNYTLPLPPPKGLAFPGVDYIGVIAAMFMFLFMATGFPHNIARFLGTRKITKREYWMMLLIIIVGGSTPLWIGIAGFAARSVWEGALMASEYYPMYGDSAAVYVSISAGGIPLASLFAASVFAASVATIAGMVMIMATNITRDLIHNAYPKTSPKKLFWLTKLMLTLFIAIPLWWTFTSPPPILSEFMAGSAVAQAGIFFFVVGVSMYWKRATKWGAIATIIYGLILTILHPNAYGKVVGLHHWGCWALLLMFGAALIYFSVSLATKPVSEEKLEKLFSQTRRKIK
ncbi:MAG: sodium:solute symporter family protein [Candidatus Bathyarchaeota archaeon]|nr:sodium:solute symporter family protein [Candidatus Bathyarchaeota archaeon]MDH5495351.1 sodium:solute symporter family protein [Candidatus Bathyarchaeota archaeon]